MSGATASRPGADGTLSSFIRPASAGIAGDRRERAFEHKRRRSAASLNRAAFADQPVAVLRDALEACWTQSDELKEPDIDPLRGREDRKSTRLNSSHLGISYAVFCLKKKK